MAMKKARTGRTMNGDFPNFRFPVEKSRSAKTRVSRTSETTRKMWNVGKNILNGRKMLQSVAHTKNIKKITNDIKNLPTLFIFKEFKFINYKIYFFHPFEVGRDPDVIHPFFEGHIEFNGFKALILRIKIDFFP